MNYLDLESLGTLINNIKFVGNRNYLLNPDFKINQRNGYITKLDCTLYTDPELTTIATDIQTPLIAPLQIGFIGVYTSTVPINEKIYYLNKNDIEPGYVGTNKYTFDRWLFAGYLNMVRPSDNYVTFGGSYLEDWSSIFQSVDPVYYNLNGKTVTFTMKLRTHTSTGVTLRFQDGVSEYYAFPQHTGDWEIVSITTTIPQNSTRLYVGVGIHGLSSGTVDIAWAKLEEGDCFTHFEHPEYSIELIKCKFYYEEVVYNHNLAILYNNVAVMNIPINYPKYRRPYFYFKNNVFNDRDGTYVQYRDVEPGWTFEIGEDYNRTDVIHLRAYKDNDIQFDNGMIVVTYGNPICVDSELIL